MANRTEKSGSSDRFYILWLQNHWNHEIKRHLLLRRKAMTNLDSVLKSRDIILSTKVHIVKAMVFLAVIYRCERIIKKTEHWRIDAFELGWWRRLSRVSGTVRSSQSIERKSTLNIHWKGLMLYLKLQHFCHLMWKIHPLERPWCWERMKAKGEEGSRGWDGWMPLNEHEFEPTSGDSDG